MKFLKTIKTMDQYANCGVILAPADLMSRL